MSESISINKNLSEQEIYKTLIQQLKGLINPEEPVISNLSNLSAALKEAFDKISWVGFYLYKNERLFLGPFQGKVACTIMELGKGVCGTAAETQKTIIVEDVKKFPGHIACDAGSKSEIVVPIISDGELFGVLDLDSYEYSAFNETDKKNLEELVTYLCNKINLNTSALL